MPTENSDLMSKELFFEDRFGNIQKLGKVEELQQYESKTDEKDDAVDALKYAVDSFIDVKKGGNFTIQLTKDASRRFQKTLGIERITRKRFIKLLMGCRIQRNDAEKFADIVRKNGVAYSPVIVQIIIEWIIKNIQGENL